MSYISIWLTYQHVFESFFDEDNITWHLTTPEKKGQSVKSVHGYSKNDKEKKFDPKHLTKPMVVINQQERKGRIKYTKKKDFFTMTGFLGASSEQSL